MLLLLQQNSLIRPLLMQMNRLLLRPLLVHVMRLEMELRLLMEMMLPPLHVQRRWRDLLMQYLLLVLLRIVMYESLRV